MNSTCDNVNLFEKLNRIGEGTYGTVYRAREKSTGRIVALKKVIFHDAKEGFPLTSLREIHILKQMRHENIVELYSVVVGKLNESVFLVFEYCEHDLSYIVDTFSPRPFSEAAVKCLMQQLLRAVVYMHDHWIVHRDIKMSNLLYTKDGILKVADFGLARKMGYPLKEATTKVVTLWYRPPELLLGSTLYGMPIDLWSVGCIFGELLNGEPLFPGKSEIDQIDLIYRLLGAPNEHTWPGVSALPNYKLTDIYSEKYSGNKIKSVFPKLSPEGVSFMNGLLTYDPQDRLTAVEALDHVYFKCHPLPLSTSFLPTFPVQSERSANKKRRHSDDTPVKNFPRENAFGSMFG